MSIKFSYDIAQLEQLPVITPVVDEVLEFPIKVTESGLASILAAYLFEAVMATSPSAERALDRAGLDQESFTQCVIWVIRKRVEQVAKLRPGSEYKHVEFPMSLYPLVEMFGRVESYESGLVIWPEQLDAGREPQQYQDFIRIFKTHGFSVAKGLPRAVNMTTDLFYRLTVRDGIILAACDGKDIDPSVVLMRCFYDFPMVSAFGVPRYSLGPVAAQRTALDLLVRLGIKDK